MYSIVVQCVVRGDKEQLVTNLVRFENIKKMISLVGSGMFYDHLLHGNDCLVLLEIIIDPMCIQSKD